jgi:hypothetical protein
MVRQVRYHCATDQVINECIPTGALSPMSTVTLIRVMLKPLMG